MPNCINIIDLAYVMKKDHEKFGKKYFEDTMKKAQ